MLTFVCNLPFIVWNCVILLCVKYLIQYFNMSFIDSKGAPFSFDLLIMKVFLNQYEFYLICRPSWLFFQYYRACLEVE
jgi:hypothetical protein